MKFETFAMRLELFVNIYKVLKDAYIHELVAILNGHFAIMKVSTFLFIFIFIATCSFSQNTSLTSYKVYFDNDLKSWTQSFENFKLAKFKISDTIKFESIPFDDTKNLKEFYALYKPGLSFSLDSSQFIDIYSYWLNLEKKKNKIVANVDVDQAVSLCDLKNNKWTRIFFCGYSTRIDEVLWIDNKNFILAGTIMDDNNVFHPKILIGNTTKKTFFVYTDGSIVSTKTGYISAKLKKLNIHDE